jgi:quercetin dioxygenase-like cupin family protein
MDVTFKVESDDEERATLLEIVVAPGFDTGLHRHRKLEETFYVLDGQMTFTAGDGEEQVFIAGPGATIALPPGTAHRVANRSNAPAKALLSWTPGPTYRVLDELADVLARPGDPDLTAIAEISRRYDTEDIPTPTVAQH